jgi:hypothetical protein
MLTKRLVLLTQGGRALNDDHSEAPSRAVPDGLVESTLLGGDVWAMGAVPDPRRKSGREVRWRLSATEAAERGKVLLRIIHQATASTACGNVIREVTRLNACFPDVTLRVAAVHDYLDRYRERHGDAKLGTLLRQRAHRGRPTSFTAQIHALCWMLPRVSSGWSVARAADEVRRTYADLAHYCTPQSLQNLWSDYGEWVRIYAEGYFVPARHLQGKKWGPQRQWRIYCPPSRVELTPPSKAATRSGRGL